MADFLEGYDTVYEDAEYVLIRERNTGLYTHGFKKWKYDTIASLGGPGFPVSYSDLTEDALIRWLKRFIQWEIDNPWNEQLETECGYVSTTKQRYQGMLDAVQELNNKVA